MMKIAGTCGACQRRFRTSAENAGRRGRCAGCGSLVRIPRVAIKVGAAPHVGPTAQFDLIGVDTGGPAGTGSNQKVRVPGSPLATPVKPPRWPWIAGGVGLIILAGGLGIWLLTRDTGGTGLEHQRPNDPFASAPPATPSAPAPPPSTTEKGKPGDDVVPNPPRDDKKADKLPGVNGPFFEYVGKSDARVTGADLGVGINDPKPEKPPSSRTLPSGTKEFFVSVKFEKEPEARTIAIDVYNDKGKVGIAGGVIIEERNNRTGAYTLIMGRKPTAGNYEDGSYQAKVLLDSTVVALINWVIGGPNGSAPGGR